MSEPPVYSLEAIATACELSASRSHRRRKRMRRYAIGLNLVIVWLAASLLVAVVYFTR